MSPVTQLVAHADALYRAASECHRQHSRYARLVQIGAEDEEQRSALEIAYLADDALGSAVLAYEKASKAGNGIDELWWRKANMLWHASREYIRRHSNCDGMARRLGRQSPNRLAELALAFDLEASALLALRMAADSYREARPDAE